MQQLEQQQTAGGRGGDQTKAKRSLQWSSAVARAPCLAS